MRVNPTGSTIIGSLVAGVIITATPGCAPRTPYRVPVPPSASAAPAAKPAPALPPPAQETVSKPLPQEPKIKEQDVKSRPPLSTAPSKQTPNESKPTEAAAPPLADDSSLLAKITPGTSAQRAASLRLTEEGRKLLDAGDAPKALSRLERTIAIDSSNPYGYFYLAKAQYRLRQYKESLNFLDVAESRLSGEPFWLAEVYALRGENYGALGMAQNAEASYAQALRLNSGNRTAADALSRLHGEGPTPVADH
jgi:predicted negative regulator of RcsB-dependent stress response